MLPVIAGYFGVTVDELIGSDIDEKEARIQFYCTEYERLNLLGDEACIEIAQRAYTEYPYEWRIIDIYIRSLTKGYTVLAGDRLPELRALCRFVMDNCNDASIRKTAIYSMLFAEDDDKVEAWFDEVPVTYDFANGERREERYLDRGNIQKYKKQKQENMMELFVYFWQKLTCRNENITPDEMLEIAKRRFLLLDALFSPNGKLIAAMYYCEAYRYMAKAYFALGETESGITMLEELIKFYKEAILTVREYTNESGKVQIQGVLWGEIERPLPRKGWLGTDFIEKLGETYGLGKNIRYKKLLCEVKAL